MTSARLFPPLLFLLAFIVCGARAGDFSALPPAQQTKLGLYLTPKEAYDRAAEHPTETLFLDVRSPEELAFLGVAPVVDANIPFYFVTRPWEWDESRKSLKLEPNPDFEAEVEKRLNEKSLGKDAFVIVICGTAKRSARAVNLLAGLGYTQAYTVVEGFEGDSPEHRNGWKNAGLPWGYALDPKKLYWLDGRN